jgi:hypothetical protein
MESLRSSERILQAIETADEERLQRDESKMQGVTHTPTVAFSTFAKGFEPYEYVMKQLDSIPTPDLDQAILILPSRLFYSLLLYCEQAMDTAYLSTAAHVFNAAMRLFFNEIVADKLQRPIMVSIRDKLRARLDSLDSLYLFNMSALQFKP